MFLYKSLAVTCVLNCFKASFSSLSSLLIHAYFDEVLPCTSPFGRHPASIIAPGNNVTWGVHMLRKTTTRFQAIKKPDSSTDISVANFTASDLLR